jgi:hypothetical protein
VSSKQSNAQAFRHMAAKSIRQQRTIGRMHPRSHRAPVPLVVTNLYALLFSVRDRACFPGHTTPQNIGLALAPPMSAALATNVSRPRLKCLFDNGAQRRTSGRCPTVVIPDISSLPLGIETVGSALGWTLDPGPLLPQSVGAGHVRRLKLD